MYNDKMVFAESHEWAVVDGDTATIGITHHAQDLLGDVVYVELPQVGEKVVFGETIGVVESVKAASDLYAPLSGDVIDVNTELESDPSLINSDPHQDGWLVKIKLSNPSEVEKLLTLAKYKDLIG